MGWKLDREDFESSSPVFLLSFGNPFLKQNGVHEGLGAGTKV